jgi:hypothetical protein
MINIISKSIIGKDVNGPQKVVSNLIKGLDILGYPYCINKALNTTSQLWIHDDSTALKEASRLKIKAIVGPNIYIIPRNIPQNLDLTNFVYIHPSKWAADFWKDLGFNKCPLDYWPAGINTDEFVEREKPNDGLVLIYFKQRYTEELKYLEKILNDNNIKYETIIYGSYNQSDYLEKLKNTKYVIWLGRQESQGIALEEAMATNVPILVWDILKIGHWSPTKKEIDIFTKEELEYTNCTSAYYFDETCGIITKNIEEIEESIKKMELVWQSFKPREYILKNLSLEKQAKDFIELFNKHYGISYEEGKKEIQKTKNKWRNDKIEYKVYAKLKVLVKKCLKLLKK